MHTTIRLPLGKKADGERRLPDNAGLQTRAEDGKVFIDELTFGGAAQQAGADLAGKLSRWKKKISPVGFGFRQLLLFAVAFLQRAPAGMTPIMAAVNGANCKKPNFRQCGRFEIRRERMFYCRREFGACAYPLTKANIC